MSNTSTATLRTTVNGTVLTAVLALVAKFTGIEVTLEDVLPWTPIIVPIIAVFYRASLYLSEKFPKLGWVLFGRNTPPTY